jgi:tRNA pseudouridine38-40 synthase
MRNILLTLSYDGTHFSGWQKQENEKTGYIRTVQDEIEKVLALIHKEPIALAGSGRTDSGVHAAGQAATFISPIDSIPIENYIPAINSRLPHDIRVLNAVEKPMDFHARFSATRRTYRYFIHCGSPLAHQMPYVWPIYRYPDIEKLNRMASCLQGEIDCTTFSAAGDLSVSKHRFLEKAVFYPEGDTLVFEICANAFLWKMVRSITGSLLHYELKGKDKDFFQEILDAKDRRKAGPTAPAKGLFLWNVGFSGKRIHP